METVRTLIEQYRRESAKSPDCWHYSVTARAGALLVRYGENALEQAYKRLDGGSEYTYSLYRSIIGILQTVAIENGREHVGK